MLKDSVAGNGANIDMLVSMGFDAQQAELAIIANDGNVDGALDDLLSGKCFAAEEAAPYQEQETSKARGSRAAGRGGLEDEEEEEEAMPPKRAGHPGRAVSSGMPPLTGAPNKNRRPGCTVSSGMAPMTSTSTQKPQRKYHNQVGAVAVPGPVTLGYEADDLEAGGADPVRTSTVETETHHEEAYPDLPIAAEVVVPSEAYAPPSRSKDDARPYWTRKRVLLAALVAVLLVLVGCAVAGALLALKPDDMGQDQEQLPGGGNETVGGSNNGQETTPSPVVTTQPVTTQPPTQPPVTTQPQPTEDPIVNTDTIRAKSNVGDRFGEHVAISRDGTTIASGASKGNYVEVYHYDGNAWNQIGQTLVGDANGDQFGRCVDINSDGTMVAVGAWNNDDAGLDAGHAKVFRYDNENNEWDKVGDTLEGDATLDRFGWYVSLSDDGKTLAVSAREADPGGRAEAGLVRVFSLDDSDNWERLGNDIEGESPNEQFGRAMALSKNGRRLAVGTTEWNQRTGIVRVFDYSGTWNQVGADLTGTRGGDYFGTGVALSGTGSVLAIGSDGYDVTTDGNEGLVRVYHLEGCCTWAQYGQDLVGEGVQARLGMHQVALSEDGCCLVVGANHLNSSMGKGYMYALTDNQWKQVVELSGEQPNDRFGESVSVSGDGTIAVFGAREADTTRPGYFRVYYASHERPC